MMNANLIAGLVDAAIPFLGGLYATLLGNRIIGKKPGVDPNYDQKLERLVPFFKFGGPFLMVFGMFLVLKDLMSK